MIMQLQSWLQANRSAANVIYVNKELHAFKDIATADDLYGYATAHLPEGGDNYLLIDEVQDITDYEDALRSLHAENRCQIVATGSNAYIFSSELSTRLSGRYVEIPIHSLTYRGFLRFHGLQDSDTSLQSYLRVGGLPGLCHYDVEDESQVRDYLQGVYNTIMLRDVIAREEIRNVTFIENLAVFIADNIGKLISVRNITNTMKSHGEKVSEMLTSAYLRHLCGALIVIPVKRFDIHGKRIFEQNNKFYFADHGLRNLLCGFNLRGSIDGECHPPPPGHARVQGHCGHPPGRGSGLRGCARRAQALRAGRLPARFGRDRGEGVRKPAGHTRQLPEVCRLDGSGQRRPSGISGHHPYPLA